MTYAFSPFITRSIRYAGRTALGQTKGGAGKAIGAMLEVRQSSPQADGKTLPYYCVGEGHRSLVENAVSNNWGSGPYGVAYGKPIESGYISNLPYQPDNMAGAGILSAHKGEWIVLVGDPFAEGCTPVGPGAARGSGCYLVVFATPSEADVLKVLREFEEFGRGYVGYVLFEGLTEAEWLSQSGKPDGILDTTNGEVSRQIKRAFLGARWGALIGGAAALVIIGVLATRKRT